jgi:hypothetical protein
MQRHSDLFLSALHALHDEAPIELLKSLRDSLEHIRAHNPQSAQTAEACLAGLASDSCTLLHVLTAAYLINGGVMLKHTLPEEQELTLTELEAELQSLTEERLVASPAPDPPRPRTEPRARPAPAPQDTPPAPR